MAQKNLFCKLDCSKAYHCLQLAAQHSIELLEFNFASRTFAYRRLAQRHSWSLLAFSSFIREDLDPVIKVDQCPQCIDDIGIAANTPQQLIINLQAVLQCLKIASLKLTMAKSHFAVGKRSRFHWAYNNNQGSSPKMQKDFQISRKSQITKIQKSTSTLRWIFELSPKVHTQIGRNRSLRFLNYSKQRMPKPNFRSTLT